MKAIDPVSENMNVLMGKPVKAFIHQDHEAHIQVHLSAMQDPKIMQMVGQNPQAQMIQGAGMAHLMEHLAYQYRREIEKQLGAALPPMPEQAEGDEEAENILPPQVEVQISQLAAMASAKLLQKDTPRPQYGPAAGRTGSGHAAADARRRGQGEGSPAQAAEGRAGRRRQGRRAKLKESEVTQSHAAGRRRCCMEAARIRTSCTQQQQLELMRIAADIAKTEDAHSLKREEGDKQRGHDMQKHGTEMADRSESRQLDFQKHGDSLADRAEDRATKAEQAKQKAKPKTVKKKVE